VTRKIELAALLVVDAAALCAAYALYYLSRFEWQWFGPVDRLPASFVAPMIVVALFWMALFFFSGLYRERYAGSRLDELASLAKVVTIGILVLFFVLFIETLEAGSARSNLIFYWGCVFALTAAGRVAVRTAQKALILRGYGVHKALIVGWSDRVEALYRDVTRYPEAGLRIVGAVRLPRNGAGDSLPAGGDGGAGTVVAAPPAAGAQTATSAETLVTEEETVAALPRLIDELEVQDVLIALGEEEQGPLMDVLRSCDGKEVTLKLVPDFYTTIGGMARTEHMYGLPLIEVLPVPMHAWEQSTKRLLDVAISLVVLVGALPLWLVLGALVRLTSRGPAIYRQRRVGQHGREFTMYKFRTMYDDAEARTGPTWAVESDPRYTPVGRWLRTWRLDEVPQFLNVLRGDMSFVGPRPERPYFVDKLSDEIPLYKRRHRVKPGITGLAQVKWKYDEDLEDVRSKVKYDLFYIENMSLRMDAKILLRTIRTALSGEGK
jgi:exopolysaccharide biosynthesis polyprenyl glycosylphosphotransferase